MYLKSIMKLQTPLLLGILAVSALFSSPAVAQTIRIEKFFGHTPPYRTEGYRSESLNPVEQRESSNDRSVTNNNLVEMAARSDRLQTFATAINAADLESTLLMEGSYTIFAPTDEAFAKLPPRTLEQLLQPENRDLLRQVLSYHVVPSEIRGGELQSGQLETLVGSPLEVQVDASGRIRVERARVVQPDIQSSNGVIHAIDRVILPPAVQSQLSETPTNSF